jgi:hypothetical protein
MIDLNAAEQQRSSEPIPDNETVPVHLTLRPGGHGPGGWLKRSRDGRALMLDCEFTVLEGPHARRKFWTMLTIEGETAGHLKAAEISRSRVRAMLESARGIRPSDASESAGAARRISSWEEIEGLRFWAVVGIEKGEGAYPDKNVLKAVVTPDRRSWSKLEQLAPAGATPSAQIPAPEPVITSGSRPSWAG